jgi:hypothetical protein
MAFGKGTVPEGYVVRTFSTKVTATRTQHRRAFEFLASGGDVWAWCIDRANARIRAGLPGANSLGQLWVDQRVHGPFGELSSDSAQDVIKAWSAAFFEAMRKRRNGGSARLPVKKHHLVPVTWRKGRFAIVSARAGLRTRDTLETARGRPGLTSVWPESTHTIRPWCAPCACVKRPGSST